MSPVSSTTEEASSAQVRPAMAPDAGPTTSASAPETWTKRVSASAFQTKRTAPDGLGFHTVVGVLAVSSQRLARYLVHHRRATRARCQLGTRPTIAVTSTSSPDGSATRRQAQVSGDARRVIEPKALQARALPRCEPRGQRFGDGPEQVGLDRRGRRFARRLSRKVAAAGDVQMMRSTDASLARMAASVPAKGAKPGSPASAAVSASSSSFPAMDAVRSFRVRKSRS